MKIIRWIGHPVIIIILYLLLIIEGDQFGGFFVLYLLLSLPHGATYAIIATVGIIGLVYAFNIHSGRHSFQRLFLYVFSYLLMILALILFFSKGNKWETFAPGVPMTSFLLFAFCSLCFLIRSANDCLLFFKTRRGVSIRP